MQINKKVLVIFLGFIVISWGNKQDVLLADSGINEILETYRWNIPVDDWAAISFKDNRFWLGLTGPGGHSFCRGTYETDGLTIRINYPDEIDDWLLEYESYQKVFNWMFPDKEPMEFQYDKNYVDFNVLGCLRNGDKVLINLSQVSPTGEKYILDGIEVVKYNERENHIIVLENLRMRERPSINSPTVDLDVYISGLDKGFKGNILHKNSVNSFDAITTREDFIDGITAPWYRVDVILNEIYSQKVWVFGGYVKRIPEPNFKENRAEYYQKYYNTLFELKVIKR